MILSAFVYNPGGGAVTFTPTYPPKGKQPVDAMSAVRHDSITTSGLKQSVTERIDNLNSVEFLFVPQSDLASWRSFMAFALAGGQFNFVPDTTSMGVFETYTLVDTDWSPKFVGGNPIHFSFSLSMRKV